MEPKYKPGQKVEIAILRETDLGFVARIIDSTQSGKDQGLLYHNEIFEHLKPGMEIPAYVKKMREDGAIDLILQPFGNLGTMDLGHQILDKLEENNGFLPVNSDTSAEEIHDLFGVSKKKFKMAIGGLYKKRMIVITEKGIQLVKN